MKTILDWFRYYNNEITWWIIGWMSFAVLDSIIRENWGFVALDIALIYLNYKLWKSNNA